MANNNPVSVKEGRGFLIFIADRTGGFLYTLVKGITSQRGRLTKFARSKPEFSMVPPKFLVVG